MTEPTTYRIAYCPSCRWVYPGNVSKLSTVSACPTCDIPVWFIASVDEGKIEKWCGEHRVKKPWKTIDDSEL